MRRIGPGEVHLHPLCPDANGPQLSEQRLWLVFVRRPGHLAVVSFPVGENDVGAAGGERPADRRAYTSSPPDPGHQRHTTTQVSGRQSNCPLATICTLPPTSTLISSPSLAARKYRSEGRSIS